MRKMFNIQCSIFNVQRRTPCVFIIILILSSCSLQKKIGVSATKNILNTPELHSAHVGISIYEPATGNYWYNYQSDKFFTPASNTKIFSCYAGMKYLGDSLTGLTYTETDKDIFIQPTGDPSLLHPDYKNQPVISFLQRTRKNIFIINNKWQENAWGTAWSWNDYNDDYAAERSALPVYGNTIKFIQTQTAEGPERASGDQPSMAIYTEPEIDWKLKFSADTGSSTFGVQRAMNENVFTVTQSKEKNKAVFIPFITDGVTSALELLKDTIGREIKIATQSQIPNSPSDQSIRAGQFLSIHSQPADSIFKPMMHRSDNFFAEQTLLMVSNKVLGVMNDAKIIDTLLRTDLKDLPQKPNWADGSGLSRFNQFTPKDFIWILNKIKTDFTWKRITGIFQTGNEGTLTNYYQADSSFIYAKTGTLTGVVALSGYLITKKNKTLIFSVLVNNHQSTGRNVRRAVEKFIQSLRDNY